MAGTLGCGVRQMTRFFKRPETEITARAHRQESILCATRGAGRTLDFAIREAGETGRRLYLLFVREQRFMTGQDVKRKWQEDPEAAETFAVAKEKKPQRSSASFLLCRERIRCSDDRRYRRDSRCVASDSWRTQTQRPHQSPSRQRHPRSFKFPTRRNRPPCLRLVLLKSIEHEAKSRIGPRAGSPDPPGALAPAALG